MNVRPAAWISLTALAFAACGRMDLGAYAELPSDDAKDPTDPPAATSGAAGEPPSNEAGATGQAVGGEGGAATTRGAAGEAANEGGAGEGGAGDITPGPLEKKSCRSSSGIFCGPIVDKRSCCEVAYVSAGELVRGGIKEGEPPPAASRVSGFYLGVFEVTKARFQAFLEDYDAWRASGAPRPGDGAHPIVPNSGWREEWLRAEGAEPPSFEPGAPESPGSHGLGFDRETVEGEVSDCLDTPLSTFSLLQPVNCVSWYEAQAFCIWDGGRLPTDLEWEYAAAGGAEHRPYPWGAEEPTKDHAMYGCSGEVNDTCQPPSVGSYKRGVGRFGQWDLAGSVAEWTFDTLGPAFPTPCHDCANVEPVHSDNPRNTRGGDYTRDASTLAATWSSLVQADVHLFMHGIRCAYDAP